MRKPSFLLPAIASLLTLACTAVTALAQDEVTVYDFSTKSFTYGYDGWEDIGSVAKLEDGGLKLNATASGGAGIFFEQVQDLSEHKSLKIKLKVGAENTADQVRLTIISADNKKSIWDLDLNGVIDDVLVLDLAAPGEKPDGGADLEVVKQMQLQGKYTPGAKVDVQLQELVATNETAAK